MNIKKLVKILNDMALLYGDKIILTVKDEAGNEYDVKAVRGVACAKYFRPSDKVAEVIIEVKRSKYEN